MPRSIWVIRTQGVLVPVLVEIRREAGRHARRAGRRRIRAPGRTAAAAARAPRVGSARSGGRSTPRPRPAAWRHGTRRPRRRFSVARLGRPSTPRRSDVLTHEVADLAGEHRGTRRRRGPRRRRARPRWRGAVPAARPTSACHWRRSNPNGNDMFSRPVVASSTSTTAPASSGFLVSLPVARNSRSRISCSSRPSVSSIWSPSVGSGKLVEDRLDLLLVVGVDDQITLLVVLVRRCRPRSGGHRASQERRRPGPDLVDDLVGGRDSSAGRADARTSSMRSSTSSSSASCTVSVVPCQAWANALRVSATTRKQATALARPGRTLVGHRPRRRPVRHPRSSSSDSTVVGSTDRLVDHRVVVVTRSSSSSP